MIEPSQERGRLLIVEDSPDLQGLLARILKREGYSVECADNGKEALDRLGSANPLPDLIMLDLMMPDLDGYQFRERQARISKIADIPVIVMTADGDIRMKSETIQAQAFLKKPFTSIEAILTTVGRFFVAPQN